MQIFPSVNPKLSLKTSSAGSLTLSQVCLLDWTRGLAAQIVLLGHVASHNGLETKGYIQDFGVVLFFLLSGFLITRSILYKESSYDFVDFLIDRGARIFVPYLPAILVIVGIGLALNLGGPYDPVTIVGNALLLQDFPLHRWISAIPEIDRVGTGRPLWSVSVEWWLYMAFAGAAFSYSLYLIHYTVMNAVPGWSAILFANLLAIVMWFLFERHHRLVARKLRALRESSAC